MSDLSRLNEGERRILELLAQGHTVKSIANATGWTVAAVNERLRSARHKSGVGSSRELARLYAEQNRPRHDSPTASPAAPSVGSNRHWKWIIPAVVALVLLAAVAARLSNQPPQPSFRSDSMIGNLLTEEQELGTFFEQKTRDAYDEALLSQGSRTVMRRLHSQVRSERRDDRWSPAMEASLRRIFLQVPSLRSPNSQLRILCSANFCEVTANLPMRQFVEGGLYLPEFQDPKQEAAVEALGLKSLVKILGSRNPSQALYLSYWSRKATNDKTNAKRS